MTDASDPTRLLREIRSGSDEAASALFVLLRDHLGEIARGMMRGERADHTLQPTALVNEAWLRLVGPGTPEAEDRRHFLRLAARTMRRVLVDHARARARDKRGGGATRLTLLEDTPAEPDSTPLVDVLDLEAALAGLEDKDAELARIVELRFFAGLTLTETADVLGTTEEGVRWGWKLARAWLRRELDRGESP